MGIEAKYKGIDILPDKHYKYRLVSQIGVFADSISSHALQLPEDILFNMIDNNLTILIYSIKIWDLCSQELDHFNCCLKQLHNMILNCILFSLLETRYTISALY